MKARIAIGLFWALAFVLSGCANKQLLIKDHMNSITGAAQTAKESFYDCQRKSDKSSCDDVIKYLDQIIILSNEAGEGLR